MMEGLATQWQQAFLATLREHENAIVLREAALQEKLGEWTKALTGVVVMTCRELGWDAAAKGHRLASLPIPNSEYLNLDVMAFAPSSQCWRFPLAVFELENSISDRRVAYSLWKVLCVRAELRVVFCYRRDRNAGAALTKTLSDEIICSLDLKRRANLDGQTLLVVGSRDETATFPYNFFKWWLLECNTSCFKPL